ncbi:MAG: hypothetical protein HY754_00310 [Nitrospirae bacterium]|nr:hypothetical protein [Nitrospirota bacterium]
MKRTDYPLRIDIVGRNAPPDFKAKDNIFYHGKVKDSLPLLRDADLVVVNGGFSAVSEAFYMRKPMIVIPVPNHAEQWINARTVEHLGVGIMANENNYEDKIIETIAANSSFHEAYGKLSGVKNGAEGASEVILGMAK